MNTLIAAFFGLTLVSLHGAQGQSYHGGYGGYGQSVKYGGYYGYGYEPSYTYGYPNVLSKYMLNYPTYLPSVPVYGSRKVLEDTVELPTYSSEEPEEPEQPEEYTNDLDDVPDNTGAPTGVPTGVPTDAPTDVPTDDEETTFDDNTNDTGSNDTNDNNNDSNDNHDINDTPVVSPSPPPPPSDNGGSVLFAKLFTIVSLALFAINVYTM